MPRQKKLDTGLVTTPQHLSSIIKSVRDIMRKDKGLNGDLDRIPMITWIMFLKFLDDHEQIREAESKLNSVSFQPVIEAIINSPIDTTEKKAAYIQGLFDSDGSYFKTKYNQQVVYIGKCLPTLEKARAILTEFGIVTKLYTYPYKKNNFTTERAEFTEKKKKK